MGRRGGGLNTATDNDYRFEPAARALREARRDRRALMPLREWLDPKDLEAAYAIQALNTNARLHAGARRAGRKIGLTSKAVQRQLGVDQPDFGTLFDDMVFDSGSHIGTSGFLQPRIEGELAFVVARDVTESGLPRSELASRAGDACAAFEIVDSAIADWKITLADTVADNASCGAIVMGTQRRRLADFDARLAGMVMSEDQEIVSLGVGAASLGDPLNAFAWLAELAIRQGDPIRAGEIVLTGALGPMVPLVQGRVYRLEIGGFSPITVVAE